MDLVLNSFTTMLQGDDGIMSALSKQIPAITVFIILVGPLFMPALVALARQLPWLLWRLIVIAAAVLTDEIVKAVLVALAAAAGFAGVLHYFP